MKTILFVVGICLLPVIALAQQISPDGWRFPIESDYTGDWKKFRGSTPVPFHIKADFNGDGLSDDAWILISTQNKGYGLFAFIAQNEGDALVIPLDIKDPEKDIGWGAAQGMGVAIAKFGEYKTACGKGYWECQKGEPELLKIINPSINYFHYESSSSIFWWNKKENKFIRTWISD